MKETVTVKIDEISAQDARILLSLIPPVFKLQGINVCGDLRVKNLRDSDERALLIDIVLPNRDPFDVRLEIHEYGAMYVKDTISETTHPVSNILFIDYLRKEKIIDSPQIF